MDGLFPLYNDRLAVASLAVISTVYYQLNLLVSKHIQFLEQFPNGLYIWYIPGNLSVIKRKKTWGFLAFTLCFIVLYSGN